MSSHPPPSPSSLQHQHQDLAPSSPFSNSQFGDTTLTKVFVGGLAWETQRDSVRRYFEQFGEILEAVVITDKATGRSKGYGFVTFRDPEGARRACADPTPVIDGRRANCNLASLGVRSRPGTPQQGGRFRGGSPAAGRSPGRAQAFNGAAAGSPQHLPYSYQQAFPYPPYGYVPYQQEYLYPPNMVYNGPFYVTPPFPPPLYGGGGPPPPTLGSPTAGLYPYQAFQVPYPYAASGAHMPLQNQPPPSGLTPDQSPPTNVVAGTGPQFGLPQQHFPGPGAASQHGQQSSD